MVHNRCNGGVNFMLDYDRQGAFRFAALQSKAGADLLQACGRKADDISSIVLVEQQAHYLRSEAILRIAAKLQAPFPALASMGLPFPLPVRDYVYDAVADNRYYLLGKQDSCRMSDPRFTDRFICG
jgi:predicted DCC family thiol-disulfide oxidoreductase YuxK